jgi:NAD(P)-dependent dehydrogenase (short-subunit alcohol dehydrogenase family)
VNVSSGGGQLSELSTWAPAYCISKTTLNAITVQLAAPLKPRGIAVNAVCPGWVRTDMGGPGAPRSLEQGADSILWLVQKASPDLTGGASGGTGSASPGKASPGYRLDSARKASNRERREWARNATEMGRLGLRPPVAPCAAGHTRGGNAGS